MNELPPEVYKVIGAPGTGKTTRVVGNDELDIKGLFLENLDEYTIEEQMLVTYTNAGVDEAAERLDNMIDVPKYLLKERVTTIHSQCFQTLDLDPKQVVRHKHKANFCERNDMDFEYEDDVDDLMAKENVPEGNMFYDIYGWLKSNRKELNEWHDCPRDWESPKDIMHLFTQWEEFKNERNLIQFSDMIEKTVTLGRQQLENLGWGILFPDEDTSDREMFEMARHDAQRNPEVIRGQGAFPDTKILYVDECQDLTPLQIDWYLMSKLVCDKVYLGGDDDQCIYGWAGANPDFMLDEEGDFEVLEKTYRIPRNIWEVCDDIIKQVDKRQEKRVEPHGENGDVVFMERPSDRQIIQQLEDEDDIFILFRANYMINEFANDVLHPYGIPYRNVSTFDTWDKDTVELRDALAKLDNDKKLTGYDINTLKEFYDGDVEVRDKNNTKDMLDSMGGWSSEKVKRRFNLSQYSTLEDYLHNTVDNIHYYKKEALRGNISRGKEDLYPERITLGTIHSAKGKEAETVIIATDSTNRILSNMKDETANTDKFISDSERRVYYVGCTRASEKLVIAEGVVADPMSAIPITHLVSEYEPEYAQSSYSEGISGEGVDLEEMM